MLPLLLLLVHPWPPSPQTQPPASPSPACPPPAAPPPASLTPLKLPITPDLIPLFHLELSPVNFFSDIARSAKRTPPRKCSETENIKCFFWKCASANKSQDKLFSKYIAAINTKLLFPEKIWDTKIFLVLCKSQLIPRKRDSSYYCVTENPRLTHYPLG